MKGKGLNSRKRQNRIILHRDVKPDASKSRKKRLKKVVSSISKEKIFGKHESTKFKKKRRSKKKERTLDIFS